MEKKKISFIVLSWNSEKYLKSCINSILNLKKYDVEIYIVDNGSKDDSVKIIESIKDTRIILIKLNKNMGTTISRNKALHMLGSTCYLCILDSDTVINEQAIEIMISYLELHEDCGIVGPSMVNGDGIKQIPYRKFPTWKIKLLKACPIRKISQKGEKIESYDINDITEEFSCDYLISACWMMRYDSYKEIGDLDEHIFYSPEDVEYCMRIREKGYDIVHLSKAQIIHYYQRISKKKLISKANITHFEGIYYILKKYKNFLKQYYKKGEKT